MIVYCRKHLPKTVVNDCNERIARHNMKVIRSSDSQDPGDESGSPGGSASTAMNIMMMNLLEIHFVFFAYCLQPILSNQPEKSAGYACLSDQIAHL